MQIKIEKKFLVFDITASESVSLICPYKEQDTCHWQPIC